MLETNVQYGDISERRTAADCLAEQIADPDTQWSLGTFGAIGEFMRDADEPVRTDRHLAVTSRGGLRLQPSDAVRLFAFETTTRRSWSQRVAICLPMDDSAMTHRSVLTEIGPDHEALRSEDRGDILFDVGVDAFQADICVRVNDAQLAADLRKCVGKPTFAPDNPAGRLIVTHSPHRVFTSRVGRIEIYQSIPSHNGRSPEGPHSHVLLDLLRHRRTHAATEPIPEGWVPCAYFYPAHPARDSQGNDRLFDPRRQNAGLSGSSEYILIDVGRRSRTMK